MTENRAQAKALRKIFRFHSVGLPSGLQRLHDMTRVVHAAGNKSQRFCRLYCPLQERRIRFGPDAAQFTEENIDRDVANTFAQMFEPLLQIAGVVGFRVQNIQVALVVLHQRLVDIQQLGCGLDVVSDISAAIEYADQFVPTCIKYFLRGEKSGAFKFPIGLFCDGFGDSRPEQEGGKKPFINFGGSPVR